MDSIATVPHFGVLLAVAVAALAAEALVLRGALRCLRQLNELGGQAVAASGGDRVPPAIPSRGPELLVALGPVAVVGLLVAALQEGRQVMQRAPTGDPSERAALLAKGLSVVVNTVFYGTLPVVLVTALAAVALPMAVAARLRAHGLARAARLAPTAPDAAAVWARFPGPEPFFLVGICVTFLTLGLGPIVWAAYLANIARINFFSAIARVDPAMKVSLFLRHLDASTGQLKEGLLHARIGLGLATITAILLGVVLSPARARARALGRREEPPAPGLVVLSLVFLALAAGAFVAARPMQRENDTPWPAPDTRAVLFDAETPALSGPDAVERASVIAVSPGQLLLDQRPVDLRELERQLNTLVGYYRILHPGELFVGRFLVACAPDTPRERILATLATTLHAGYDRPQFLFLRREITDRPLLGPRHRVIPTGATFHLFTARDQAEEGGVFLDEFANCADLGRRLVELRQAGKSVALIVPR
jgi:hypothetical protein